MKRLLLFGLSMICSTMIISQTFSDDFEAYTAGDYLAASNSEWTTWGGTTGTPEDVRISDERAFSGTNSIKFSSTSANGGPADVVKYFTGEKLTTGVLKTNMQMLVQTGAYFNYQAEVNIGTTWAMNAFFEENGRGRITGSGNGDILTFDYPVGEWFDWKMAINFDVNKWQLEVNGICVGSFENPDNSIASIDIYPVNGNSFFIDDFSYEYSEEVPEIVNDAIITMRTPQASALAGVATQFVGELKNGGTSVIESAEIFVSLGEDYYPITMDVELQPGESEMIEINGDYTIPAGNSDVSLEITAINGGSYVDEDLCNNKSTVQLFGLVPAEHKKVIIEEATGTWCGFCPRGSVALERFAARYPDRYIGVAVHNQDPMVDAEYDDGLDAGSFPNSVVNRGIFIDPGSTEAPFIERVLEPSSASILQGAEWDEDTRELKISMIVTAMDDISSNHKVNVVITEDGVTGTGSDYAQRNYFSGATDLIDIHGVNWRDLPDPVPAADMVYDHVARAILAPYGGVENSFTNPLSAGENKVFNFTYIVPEDFDFDNMNIVTMLINPDGTINTGEGDTVAEDIENGFVPGVVSTYDPVLNDQVNVYPNPTSEVTNVRINLSNTSDVSLQLVDMTGKVMMSKSYDNQSGLFSTTVDASTLASGAYVLKIAAGDKYTAKKINVLK